MTRIAVIGPGAIGAVIAAWLAQEPAHAVTVCARTPLADIEVDVAKRGLVRAAPRVLTDPAQAAEPADWVFVCTKTYDAEGAAAWFPGLVSPATRVAVMQNGIEHMTRFSRWLDAAQITPCVVDIPAERSAPGRIRQRRDGDLTFPADAGGRACAALFAHTPIKIVITEDFNTALWRKLCINCAGAVNAVTLKPNGVSRRDGVAAVMRALVTECAAVGRAEGAVLADDLADTIVAGYRAGPPDGMNSLHADRMAGRRMELDARNGVIVRLGEKHGIATPMNAALVALIEAAASTDPF